MTVAAKRQAAKKSRLAALKAETDADKGVASWAYADQRYVGWFVGCVTALDGAVTFGRTRDGSAATLTVYMDDDKERWIFDRQEELDDELRRIGAVFADIAEGSNK